MVFDSKTIHNTSCFAFSVECTGGRRSEDFGQETYLPVRWWNKNHLPVYLNEELCMYLLLQDKEVWVEKEKKYVMHSYGIGLRRLHMSVYFRKDSKVRAQVKMYRAVWKRGRYPERGKHITRILPFIAWAFRVPILECLDVNWGYLVGVTIWLSIELICFLNLFEQTCDVCHFLFHESSDLIRH